MVKTCGYDGSNCNGCGSRKNNWFTCQWGSPEAEYIQEIESKKGFLPDKYVYPLNRAQGGKLNAVCPA